MAAVQAMTGGGGWPMSVFLTPDGRPVLRRDLLPGRAAPRDAVVPPGARGRRPGLARAAGRGRGGRRAARPGRSSSRPGSPPARDDPTPSLLEAATAAIEASFDPVNGGWGRAPKFPQPMTIEFLLRRHVATGDARPLAIARRSLDAMADGGIHDQLGGGFHRYSTDARWLVPHFEQMLYDNAQLARVYVHAWPLTGDERYRDGRDRHARLPDPRADAPTTARSPRARTPTPRASRALTFTWRAAEIREVLGDDAPLVRGGLRRDRRGQLGGRDDPQPGRLGRRARRAVRADRGRGGRPARPPRGRGCWRAGPGGPSRPATTRRWRPGTAWRSRRSPTPRSALDDDRSGGRGPLPGGRRARRRDDRRRAARRRTARSVGRGRTAGRSGSGVLEDYTHLADGLLALYEATFDERWFTTARALMDHVLAHFADPAGGFFDTADDHERLVTRPKDVQDNAVPSGNAMAAVVLLRLARLDRRGRLPRRPRNGRCGRSCRSWPATRRASPSGCRRWTWRSRRSLEVAIVGPAGRPGDAPPCSPRSRRGYRPNQVVAAGGRTRRPASIPLLADRAGDRRPADRLRLPRLRLPAAGDRSRRPARAARGAGRCRLRSRRRVATRASRSARPRPTSTRRSAS